jgi:hypothetical protein
MAVAVALPFRKRKTIPLEAKPVLIWGWFRLFLGLTQMMAASGAILSFFEQGLVWQTCSLLGVGLGVSAFSRWLYRNH